MTETQNGFSITVDRVEFAPDETSVFVHVQNAGRTNVRFRDSTARAVQGAHRLHVRPVSSFGYPPLGPPSFPEWG